MAGAATSVIINLALMFNGCLVLKRVNLYIRLTTVDNIEASNTPVITGDGNLMVLDNSISGYIDATYTTVSMNSAKWAWKTRLPTYVLNVTSPLKSTLSTPCITHE
jgi:hypothetical protein